MKMSKSKQGRERRRLRKLLGKEAEGKVSEGTAENSLQSWIANANRGDAFYQIKRMETYFKQLERSNKNGNDAGKTSQN